MFCRFEAADLFRPPVQHSWSPKEWPRPLQSMRQEMEASMDWSREAIIALRTALANKYPMISDALPISNDAGLDRARIAFDSKAITNWFNILEFAKSSGRLDNVLTRALQDFPEDEVLLGIQKGAPPPVLEGPETKSWKGPAGQSALERILGTKSTLVPINYLEIGLKRARQVVRIKRGDGTSGTGFLIENDIIITNNHVLPDAEKARDSIAQFNYQQTVDGLDAEFETYNLKPDEFFKTSVADDWRAVKVGGSPSAKWGALVLKPAKPEVGDNVNIIQHPGGGQKQISLTANVVAYADANRVQYLTDTLPGSSGSPVFNLQWNVIALHHSGGWLTEPNAKTKTTFYRNEGILIDRVIDGLKN
jgi:V8-like Glu-specific endopeptidase